MGPRASWANRPANPLCSTRHHRSFLYSHFRLDMMLNEQKVESALRISFQLIQVRVQLAARMFLTQRCLMISRVTSHTRNVRRSRSPANDSPSFGNLWLFCSARSRDGILGKLPKRASMTVIPGWSVTWPFLSLASMRVPFFLFVSTRIPFLALVVFPLVFHRELNQDSLTQFCYAPNPSRSTTLTHSTSSW